MRDKKDSAQKQDAGRNFQRAAKPILTEYEKVQETFRKNFERLKAERLARETKPDDKEQNWSNNKRGSNPPTLQATHDRAETGQARTQDQGWVVRDARRGRPQYAAGSQAPAKSQESEEVLTHEWVSLFQPYRFVSLLGCLSSIRLAFASERFLISALIFSIRVIASDFWILRIEFTCAPSDKLCLSG
jgi:hypothetical protein